MGFLLLDKTDIVLTGIVIMLGFIVVGGIGYVFGTAPEIDVVPFKESIVILTSSTTGT